MAKFLNKKEQVIDFKLTPYGKRRLAAGKFKPNQSSPAGDTQVKKKTFAYK